VSESPAVSQLVRPGAWLVTGAVASRGSTLAAGIVAARILSPDGFGLLTLMQTVAAFFSGAAGLGLGVAITRQLAATRISDKDAAGRYLGTAIVVTLLASAGVVTVYLLGSGTISGDLVQRASRDVVVTSAGMVLFAGVAATLQGALVGLEAFRGAAAAQCSQGMSVAVGLVVGAREQGVEGALAGASIGYGVSTVVGYVLVLTAAERLGIRIPLRISRPALRQLLHYALPAFVAFLVVFAALLYGQLLLSRQDVGYAEVGLFNVAYRWHLAIVFIPTAISPALLPIMTRLLTERDPRQARWLFRIYVVASLTLTIVPAAVLALAAGPILGLSGSYYGKHPEPLILLALASIPSAANNVLSSAALSLGAARLWLLSDIALAASLLGAAAWLVNAHGAGGLAFSYLAAYVATDVVLVLGLRGRLANVKVDAAASLEGKDPVG
jgi:O-antigen/teichoic acid export membrane protein